MLSDGFLRKPIFEDDSCEQRFLRPSFVDICSYRYAVQQYFLARFCSRFHRTFHCCLAELLHMNYNFAQLAGVFSSCSYVSNKCNKHKIFKKHNRVCKLAYRNFGSFA